MSSQPHALRPLRELSSDKKRFARLLEAWAEEVGIALEGVGSWTLKDSKEERGAEPDECYCVNGAPASDDDRPDIAIEVVWTSGGINKLEVYRKLGVREVWYFQRGSLRFYALRGDACEEVARSELLPAAEPELFVRCMAEPSQTDAVRALRQTFRTATR